MTMSDTGTNRRQRTASPQNKPCQRTGRRTTAAQNQRTSEKKAQKTFLTTFTNTVVDEKTSRLYMFVAKEMVRHGIVHRSGSFTEFYRAVKLVMNESSSFGASGHNSMIWRMEICMAVLAWVDPWE